MADRIDRALGGDLTPDQRALRDRIVGSRSSDARFIAPDGGDALPGGPFAPMLLAPHVGEALQELGGRLRFGGTLPEDVREMVTLCVAGHRHSDFEMLVHRRLALAAGVPADVVEALCASARPPGLTGRAAGAVDLARTVLERRPVDDEPFADALATLGPSGLFEVVALCGYYNLLADILDLFEVTTPHPPEPTS